MSAPPRVVVIGGGIAGLSAAWECHTQGLSATVLEAQPRAGGVVRTDVIGEFVLDVGPDAFLVTKPGAIGLCRELGLEDQLISAKLPRVAYVLRNGRLHRLPEGGAFGIATRPGSLLRSSLLSARGKLRLAIEPLLPARRERSDESAGAFFRRRFGREAAERIAQPLLGGIHAGDLDLLSAQSVLPQLVALERAGRSVLFELRRQARHPVPGGPFRSFRTGMGTLVGALLARLGPGTVHLDAGAVALAAVDNRWQVRVADGATHEADLLVLAVPAHAVRPLLEPLRADAAALAGAIRYLSSACALVVYRSADISRPLQGSGYVTAAANTPEPLMATSWLTSKWDGRAPEGYTVLRGFFGGARHQTAHLADDELTRMAHASWARRFGITGDPVLVRTVRWTRGSPQHEVGHLGRVRRIEAQLRGLPAVALTGSAFRAVGLPDVIADARGAMRGLLDRWRAR